MTTVASQVHILNLLLELIGLLSNEIIACLYLTIFSTKVSLQYGEPDISIKSLR